MTAGIVTGDHGLYCPHEAVFCVRSAFGDAVDRYA
jgi:hypothetical protein